MESERESIQIEVFDQQCLSTASSERKRGRRKRLRVGFSESSLTDQFHEDCLQLERELDELRGDFEEDYLRKHWFTGTHIFVNRPIHSM